MNHVAICIKYNIVGNNGCTHLTNYSAHGQQSYVAILVCKETYVAIDMYIIYADVL